MGRKKKFIDKKESTTFHVVHRSQQDKANEGEEEASEFVLIPSGPPRDSRPQDERKAAGKGKGKGGVAGAERDHINALGLPNDGYDYDQHLKSMGGGTFVSKTGKVQHFAEGNSQGARGGGAKPAIPEEALPSGETLDRQLEAVTISEKVMDGDMRRALAAGLADVGEEDWDDESNMLDDDFVVQAAGAGEDGGFDFDAHVARLMEASAKETGLRQRSRDDDLQTKGLVRLRRDSDSESDDSEDDVATLDGGAGSDDSGEIDDALLEGLDISGAAAAGGGVPGEGTEEDRAVLDSQFEATLAAYDSDEWGELEEDDDRVQGRWDLEQHDYANTCMDDFLAANEDARWTEGVQRLPPDQRSIAAATLAIEGGGGATAADPAAAPPAGGGSVGDAGRAGAGAAAAGGGGPGGVGPSVEAAAKTATSGPRLGKLRGFGAVPVPVPVPEDEEGEEDDELHDMEHHNEYLREKPAEQWDCETIVSTYSNLDNHPSVLGTGRKAKPGRARRSPVAEGVGGGDASTVQQVALSAKTGLPLGVLPERTYNDTGMVSLIAGKNKGEKRDTEETAEEKRRRKAQIKLNKRDKRVQKKNVKTAFTSEAKVISHALANPEAPQNRSVFSYS
ncbi:conserved unknown protein [Ectocarpus siliculosus]|uniref:Protein LTV1 homolog n=1 Tax=Ectocarpus siliculosus TaxID=2880 RepID=D8LLC8_ECTSI|nr:conserved unknown protein [Ectocarpus siliculosus]|eukprot:CBN77126.1 conserved unknown protein [Ectocarpus siliculosus]